MKKKSEFLSAFGIMFEIVKALIQTLLDRGGTDDDLRRVQSDAALREEIVNLILAKRQSKTAPGSFKVFVDYAKPVGGLIADGNYGNVYGRENAEHFPTDGNGQAESELFYLHLGRSATDQEVLDEAERQGYRMASLLEHLAFGIAYPNEQNKHPVATINPQAGRGGRHWDAILRRGGSGRFLDMGWYGPQLRWNDRYRFLVARK